MTKVYDCFMFHSEFEHLRIRLEELRDVVDTFVLVEGNLTHTGKLKPLYFDENRHLFRDFQGRIIARSATLPKADANTWGREILQRAAVTQVLREIRPYDDDIILTSDVDEIPRASAIAEYGGREDICCLEETTYHYNLNTRLAEKTLDPKICRYSELRDIGAPDLRYYHKRFELYAIKDAGWHLSFMGGTDKIIEKLNSYAHHDLRDPNTEKYISRENVERSVKDRKSLFLRDDVVYERVDGLAGLPKYITDNLQHFINNGWILPS